MPASEYVHKRFGPPLVHDFSRPVSFEMSVRSGPRHCGQSSALAKSGNAQEMIAGNTSNRIFIPMPHSDWEVTVNRLTLLRHRSRRVGFLLSLSIIAQVVTSVYGRLALEASGTRYDEAGPRSYHQTR